MQPTVHQPTTDQMRERRKRVRLALLSVSARTTKEGTLQALAELLKVDNGTLSNWIRNGELPPPRAREVLLLPNINPVDEPEITFAQLVPSLADVL